MHIAVKSLILGPGFLFRGDHDNHDLPADIEELVVIAECVGGQGLAAMCQLLAQDFSGSAGEASSVLPM